MDSVVWVAPADIHLVSGLPEARRRELMTHDGAVLEGDWDRKINPKPFEEMDVYKAFRERMIEGRPWSETAFYKRVVAAINNGERKWKCRTEKQFRARCVELERLYRDIAESGFKSQKELPDGSPHHEICVAMGRDGRLIFLDGRHRLAIAKLLDLAKIPVRIAVYHRKSPAEVAPCGPSSVGR